jgi:1-phosphatidylinositol-3-phosphate 5-kinase
MLTNITFAYDHSLFSWGKFLETLIYSSAILAITPALCEHTTPPPRPWLPSEMPLPASRLNIVRLFSSSSWTMSVSLSTKEDVFELRVPRLQIVRYPVRDKASESSPSHAEGQALDGSNNEEKKVLRREIVSWWQSVAEHIDKLVSSKP